MKGGVYRMLTLVRAGERVAISEIELQDKRQDEQETHRGIHR